MPLPDAAKLLGIGSTALKMSCRKIGIARWPFPALSHRNASSKVEGRSRSTSQEHERQQDQTPIGDKDKIKNERKVDFCSKFGGLIEDLSSLRDTPWRFDCGLFVQEAMAPLGSEE
eukprot:1069571-Rhodomonas_salina.1